MLAIKELKVVLWADLSIATNVSEERGYKREGNDLHCRIDLDLYTAIMCGQSLIETDSKYLIVNIGKEAQFGMVIRLKGLGMPVYNQKNEFGKLCNTINSTMPFHSWGN